MHATIRRYEGVDVTRLGDVIGKVNQTLVPKLRELPGFAAYLLIEGSAGVMTSLGLFETSEHADRATMLTSRWITDENFDGAIPNPPKITSGEVVAHSEGPLAVACRVANRIVTSRKENP